MPGDPPPDPQDAAAAAEAARYDRLYRDDPTYRMGVGRRAVVRAYLAETPGGPLLDVGAGRGEGLIEAAAAGYDPVYGADAAESVCYGTLQHPFEMFCCLAWSLPFEDAVFGTVTCWDVLEHLPEAYVVATVAEIGRVAARRVLVSAASKPDVRDGVDLHIAARPAPTWDALLRAALPAFDVRHRTDRPTPTSAVWEAVRRPR